MLFLYSELFPVKSRLLYVGRVELFHAAVGVGPVHGVFDDRLHVGVVIDGEGLVAGLEVEDLARAPAVAQPASEHLAALEAADEHGHVRLRHVERLGVSLLMLGEDVLLEAPGDGMGGLGDPHALEVPVLAPGQVAAGAHQQPEGLGMMAGVEEDRSHALEHRRLHPLGDLVGHPVMGHVAPPDDDVGLVEHFVGDVVHVVQRHGADGYVVLALKEGLDAAVYPLGVHLSYPFLRLLVHELVVYQDVYHSITSFGQFSRLFSVDFFPDPQRHPPAHERQGDAGHDVDHHVLLYQQRGSADHRREHAEERFEADARGLFRPFGEHGYAHHHA